MTETTWCTRHERLEPIAGVLDSDIGFAAGAYSAHVRLVCGITKNIVTTARRLGHMAIEVRR